MTSDRKRIRWNGWGWSGHRDALGEREDIWSWLAEELGMPALLATPSRPIEEISVPPSRLSLGEQSALAKVVGHAQMRDDAFDRIAHALGRSYYDLLRLRSGRIPSFPDAVVYPRNTVEVLGVLAFASHIGVAVVPYGGGTSVVGGVTAKVGGHKAAIALDLSAMNKLIDCDAHSLTASAEAGIFGPSLEQGLKAHGVTLGHFPQSFEFSTLGGWIAHGGAGQSSGSYGRTADWLLGATLATPKGALRTENIPASASGPDLTNLIVGSEGAFGVITEATFRVRPEPAKTDYRAFLFRSVGSGIESVRRAVQEQLPMTMLRLSDPEETRFLRAYATLGRQASLARQLAALYLNARGMDQNACLMITGIEGDAATVNWTRERFSGIAKHAGALALGQRQGQSWREGRFNAPYLRDPMLDRGVGIDTMETSTSWSRIGNLYTTVRSALLSAVAPTVPCSGSKAIVMCHVSHAYPEGASLYFTCIFPRSLDDDLGQWRAIKMAATNAIVLNGGTVSHHHGIGEDHLGWMKKEKGAIGIEVLRSLKNALDPDGILNPGKLIPED